MNAPPDPTRRRSARHRRRRTARSGRSNPAPDAGSPARVDGVSGQYEVVAGDRRLSALKLLVQKKRVPVDHNVPCLLVADASVSLAENVQRASMPPADQFLAFPLSTGAGMTLRAESGMGACRHADSLVVTERASIRRRAMRARPSTALPASAYRNVSRCPLASLFPGP